MWSSQDACRKPQQVCGHNGETYNTVCDAFSDRVTVDYVGPCHAVGPLTDAAPDSACSLVPCPPLSSPGCQPVTPPGQWRDAVEPLWMLSRCLLGGCVCSLDWLLTSPWFSFLFDRSLLSHLCQHAADPLEQRADEHLLKGMRSSTLIFPLKAFTKMSWREEKLCIHQT